jgi:hypothetical protein
MLALGLEDKRVDGDRIVQMPESVGGVEVALSVNGQSHRNNPAHH